MTPQEAYYKALTLGKRIPKLEPVISKDAFYSYCYAKYVIKGKWELGEPAISQDACCSCLYAKYIIKGRLPDFMHNALLLSNDESAKQYIEYIK